MKVECKKENLINNVSLAEKATGKNLTLPVLGCLLLEATKDNILKIRATNLDLGIELKIPSKVIKPGIIVVPGNILYSVINSIFDSSKILLEVEDQNLVISTEKSKTVIKSLPSDDFPTLPTVLDTDNSFKINTGEFLKGIQSVWYSASTTTIKPELSSVYVYIYDKKLYFVSTDSFRLSEKIITPKNISEFEPILIPIKNILEIIKVFEYLGNKEIEVHLNNNQISFVSDEIYLTSRLIDGNFPDYKQIIPKKYSTELILLKQDFVNILKKINIFIDKSNQVKFFINVSDKSFVLRAQNKDIGETTESIETAITGDDIEISFNHRYITDCLQTINSDSISLSFNGLGKPVVIRGVSDNSFLYLIMPMNK